MHQIMEFTNEKHAGQVCRTREPSVSSAHVSLHSNLSRLENTFCQFSFSFFFFAPVYLTLTTAFVDDNQDTMIYCPCLTKTPLSELLWGFCWRTERGGQSKVKDFLLEHLLLFSACTYFCPALILCQKNCFPHTFCLKALIGGKRGS